MSEEHHVPAGPLAVRWHVYELGPVQAGALARARVELENAGAAAWRDLNVSYHWLDDRGNPIVWDGIRHAVSAEPRERIVRELQVRGPIPPGHYRLAFDLVEEGRFWLAELGNFSPELDVDVAPRDASGARLFGADGDAERITAAHREGYAAVGGSIDIRRRPRELEPYEPGGGRNPAFAHALVCPSLLPPLEPNDEVAGLPAWRPEGDEPWLYDARITLRPRLRSSKSP
ncbi:MAG TPA: hypothetical protein VKB64_02455 [Gaiellaceae bacterium]|nr:hypothetical protein [Gaiellaceae bacterium]